MSQKIIYEGQIKGFPLIKIQTEEIIKLIRQGYIRFNSLKTYRELYNKCGDKTIGDPNEGKFFIHDATIKIPEKGIEEEVKDYYFQTANENDFVFCLFGVHPEKHDSFVFSEEQKEKLVNFHEKALLITDVHSFAKRIINAANAQNLEITNGFVHYYDPTADDAVRLCSLVTNGIKSIVYHKTNDYAYQQEFRFSIPNNTGKDYIDLPIGDISDISKEFSTKQILSAVIKKAN